MLNYNILSVDELNPYDVLMQIAERVKNRRLELNMTQEALSIKAGLKLPTYRRFERTGEISLRGLLQIAFAMNMLSDFDALFAQKQYLTLEDVMADKLPIRKRGSKKSL